MRKSAHLRLWVFCILSSWCAVASAAGPILSPEFQLPGDDLDRFLPAAAYNTQYNYYLVVYQTVMDDDPSLREIQVNKIYDNGQTSKRSGMIRGPYTNIAPALVYNKTDNEFLVVYMADRKDDGTFQIWGRRVSWDLPNTDSPIFPPPYYEFQIFSWSQRSFWTPRVAWNSKHNEYLVAWTALNTVTGLANDVSAVRVAPDGQVISTQPIVITESHLPHQVDLTYNPTKDEYLLVWRSMKVTNEGDILGVRLRGDNGQIITPPGIFNVDVSTQDQMFPSIATNGIDRYIVTWQQLCAFGPQNYDIYGIELNATGTPTASSFPIEGSMYSNSTNPHVVSKPNSENDYFVVWQRTTPTGEAVFGYRLGYPIDLFYFPVSSAAFWSHENPVTAIGASNYLIVYEGDSNGDPTITRQLYARFLTFDRTGTFFPLRGRNGRVFTIYVE